MQHFSDTRLYSGGGETVVMREPSARRASDSGAECVTYMRPEDVFEQEYDRLVRSLTIIAGEREVAADAVQESFAQLVRHWGRVRGYDDPAGWVRRVALNEITDHHRSQRRKAKLLQRVEQERQSSDYALASDQELWEQLRALPEKQRTALALRYVGDLTAREVAEAMNVSEGTVARHLHRALEALNKTLREV